VSEIDGQIALGHEPLEETLTIARNVSTRYLAIGVEAALGVLILPFNVAHLGKAAYGLWMLTASVTAYFSVLDLGYAGALVKFVAQYRARRDARALNEILSTAFYIFATFGVLTYAAAIGLAMYLGRLFHLAPDQVEVGRLVLLIVSVNVAAGTAFSVFGGVINGFQRYDLNNVVGTISTIVTAGVNVLVLALGYGLVELVAATTLVRVLTYAVYRANAYRVFPGLRIRASLVRRERLREMTHFSVYILIIDWANKVNYSVDALVIGMFMNTSAVAVWAVGQRVAELTQRISNQLNEVLFPTIVDCDTASRADRLQAIFIQGTRLSLATVIALAGPLALMARPLVQAWVGPDFAGSAIVLQLLAMTVIVRVASATANTLLKGAGQHRLVAFTNALTALSNLGLSIAIITPLGLPGVAIGTLVPVCLASTVVVFPAGCRRVGLSLREAGAQAVWPAVWPASVMVLYVSATRSLVANSLAGVGVDLAMASLVYLVTFLYFGISVKERHRYLSKAAELTTRWRLQMATEGA
jgi:O-antigen/teichoic acid export membrane protein